MKRKICCATFLVAYISVNAQDTALDKRFIVLEKSILNAKNWKDTLYDVQRNIIGYRYNTAAFNQANRIISLKQSVQYIDSLRSFWSHFFYSRDGYSKAIYYSSKVTDSLLAYFYFKNGKTIKEFDPGNTYSETEVSIDVSDKRFMTYDGSHYFNWVRINNTRIQMLSLSDQKFPETYFKKDSLVIRIPGNLQTDFYSLFQTLPSSFDSLYYNCRGIMNTFIGEPVKKYFESIGAYYVIFFDKREVKRTSNEDIWIIISRAGQGEECYPVIYLRKTKIKGSQKIKSIKVENGHFCQI